MNTDAKTDPMTDEQIAQLVIESNKLHFEAMKHLTTLSTGSILLMVTFIEKILRGNEEGHKLVKAAFIPFILSILLSFSVMVQTPGGLTSIPFPTRARSQLATN